MSRAESLGTTSGCSPSQGWCYHIPGPSSPEDFMKAERKTYFFKLMFYSAMATTLALSGLMVTILSRCADGDLHSRILFMLSLGISGVLLLVLAGMPLILRNFRNQSGDDCTMDSLTGCSNRLSCAPLFEQALQESRRSLEPLSLLLVDIDRFRTINEKHGHQAGDAILSLLGKSILPLLRTPDITCRWDGNQVLVVLKDCSEKDGCQIAQKILEKIRQQRLTVGENTTTFTASIGIAQMVAADNTQALITRAETGLYNARDNGRDTFAVGYDWILIDYYCKPIF